MTKRPPGDQGKNQRSFGRPAAGTSRSSQPGKPQDDSLWQRVTDSIQPLNAKAHRNRQPPSAMVDAPSPPRPAVSSPLPTPTAPSKQPTLSPTLSKAPRTGSGTADQRSQESLADLKRAGVGGHRPTAPSPGADVRKQVRDKTKPLPAWETSGDRVPGVDRRTASKLVRGQMPIDARLDLHGDRQHQAQDRLHRFISASHQAGHRCVLVITGKGKRVPGGHPLDQEAVPGVIRRRLVEWLAHPALQPLILAVKTAQAKDGGEGAFYVLLRRRR